MMKTTMIDGFWADVLRLLVEKHGFSQSEGSKYVEHYRPTVTNDGVGEAIIHFGPERLAQGIREAHENSTRTISDPIL